MVKTSYQLILISLICLLLPLSLTQTCANIGDPSYLLQSGKIQVFNSYAANTAASSRLHTYSVAITYPLPSYGFQISASIGSYILTSVFGNSYDFSVRAGKGSNPNSAQIVLFLSQDATWTTLTISYLISSRNDLFLGSFIADGYIFQSTANNQLTVKFGVPNWVANSNQVSGVTEFAGIRTFVAQPLLLSFISTTINAQTGVITIIINTNAAFQLLYLTYYWWINGPSLAFSSSTATSPAALAYQFIGIDSISGSQLTFASSGFNVAGTLSCNGLNCPSACVSSTDCQNFQGVLSGSSCFLCGIGQTFTNNNCQNSVTCGEHQYFDGFSCVCTDGYQLVNGTCLLSCGDNAYVDSKKQCKCLSTPPKSKAPAKAKKNQPPAKGGKGNPAPAPAPAPAPKSACNIVKICTNNQILVDNICQCDDGYALVNGVCSVVFSCTGGAVWNPPTSSCVCGSPQLFINGVCSNCPANSQWNGTACACNSGYNSVNGACVACPPMSIWISSQQGCVCLSGYYMVNGVCITCPINEGWNGAACVCLSGFSRVNGVCTQCTAGMVWTGSVCTCPNSQYLIAGTCQECPASTAWNGSACACVSGYYSINNICQQLPANSYYNGTAFLCNPSYYLINGVCTQCWANSIWSGSACVCISGYYLSGSSCLSCQANSAWNGQACVCLSGYYAITSGTCSTCQANSVWNGQICTCVSGYYLSNGACISCQANASWNGTACVCLSGYNLVNGACTQCPAGTVWTGSGCGCASGSYLIGGKCQPCPINTDWNGTACACISGYYLISNVCQKLPVNSYYNGTTFLCNANFYLIDGVCTQCWANSVWSGSTCVCLSGYYASGNSCVACGANSAWNGQACVCLSGFYAITNGTCSACQANSAWNGTACVCFSGFYLLNNACLTCPAGSSWNGSTCVQSCPLKSSWNGSACVCIANFSMIQNSCLPCDFNSVYNAQLQTCTCNAGYFGNYQLCTACDPSCATCSAAGVSSCQTCKSGFVLLNGQCQSCPSNCLTCSDAKTCTQCSAGLTLTTQIIDSSTVIGCSFPPPVTPDSQLSLTGTVIANNLVYQGVTLSTLPAFFLQNNCANCADLFTVSITPAKLGITYSIEYVLYSQYWFVVTFNYGAISAVVPQFTFKVKINPKYKSYFTPADMSQSLSGSASPVSSLNTKPNSGIKFGAGAVGNGGINPTNTQNPNSIPIPNPALNPVPSAVSPSTSTSAQSSTRTVIGNGKERQFSENTIVSLFRV